MEGVAKRSNFIWLAGIFIFIAAIFLMLIDILYREGTIGDRKSVLVIGTHAGFKPFEYIQDGKVVTGGCKKFRKRTKS